MSIPRLAIVLPCYNEEEALPKTFRRIGRLLDDLVENGYIAPDSFACFVDDGSRDKTWELIQFQCEEDVSRFRGIKLTRNFGHQQAILAGMETVTTHCDCCITVDADLQDDLDVVRDMIDLFRTGEAEIVLGVKRNRSVDSFFKRFTAKTFYRLLDWAGCTSVENHADFRLMSHKALRRLAEYGERNLFLRGIILQLGLKTKSVHYDIADRSAGTTKYSFSKMMNLAIVGITSFSAAPLRLLFGVGMVCFVLSMLLSAWFLVDYALGNTVPGWATLVTSIWALGGIQLMGLGILGEYLGRVFIEVKQRPRFQIDEQNVDISPTTVALDKERRRSA